MGNETDDISGCSAPNAAGPFPPIAPSLILVHLGQKSDSIVKSLDINTKGDRMIVVLLHPGYAKTFQET